MALLSTNEAMASGMGGSDNANEVPEESYVPASELLNSSGDSSGTCCNVLASISETVCLAMESEVSMLEISF